MKRTLVLFLLLCFLAVTASFGQQSRPAGAPERQLPHFLTAPVKGGFFHRMTIPEGWQYDKETEVHPKIPTHFAVDFRVKRGTPVHAAADGWAMQSFQTFILPDPWQGKKIGFGIGHFVQVCNGDVCESYCHMDRVSPDIPYFPPVPENGIYNPVVVYKPFQKLLEEGEVVNGQVLKPVFIRRGQIIGYVGDTGLSWGYDESPSVTRNHKKLQSWDKPHLHFEVYTRNARGTKALRWDPYGYYAKAPAYKSGKPTLDNLWITDKNGKPLFVH